MFKSSHLTKKIKYAFGWSLTNSIGPTPVCGDFFWLTLTTLSGRLWLSLLLWSCATRHRLCRRDASFFCLRGEKSGSTGVSDRSQRWTEHGSPPGNQRWCVPLGRVADTTFGSPGGDGHRCKVFYYSPWWQNRSVDNDALLGPQEPVTQPFQ